MQKHHLFWVFSLGLVGTAVLVGIGKLDAQHWVSALGIVSALLVPSAVVRDISK